MPLRGHWTPRRFHARIFSVNPAGKRKYAGPERRKPVLIVQHAPHEHPAAVRRALEGQGIQTLWIHPYRGEAYPTALEISGLISLGGPMGANDDAEHPWIPKECALIRGCVEGELPVVGICLGGQLMARAMGGKVERHHTTEVGWFPLRINSRGLEDPVVGVAGARPTVYQWHGDTFFPPESAVLLASSEACERQAYRLGERAYGFQFHPEADHQLVHEWLAIEGVEDEIRAAQEAHGLETVQDARTQRAHALKGERASLKITAAIGSLFRQRHCRELSLRVRSELDRFATERVSVIVEFEGPQRKPVSIRGTISAILHVPAGDFAMIREENAIIWPVRLDDILSIKPAS